MLGIFIGLCPRFPDLGRIGLVMGTANFFWGLDKTTPPEALARGEEPVVPKIKPYEEGYMEAILSTRRNLETTKL